MVDEFAARLFGELDYEQEGRSCEKFQQMYGNVPRVRAAPRQRTHTYSHEYSLMHTRTFTGS